MTVAEFVFLLRSFNHDDKVFIINGAGMATELTAGEVSKEKPRNVPNEVVCIYGE